MKDYILWFIDMEGNEDFLTLKILEHEVELLKRHLESLKNEDEQGIADFTLLLNDSPYEYEDALEYIKEKLLGNV